jgi:hypothetical protein
MDSERERLGRIVREAWVRWAKTRPDPKPSWLLSYDELSEPDREADCQIGEAVRDYVRRLDEVKSSIGLSYWQTGGEGGGHGIGL